MMRSTIFPDSYRMMHLAERILKPYAILTGIAWKGRRLKKFKLQFIRGFKMQFTTKPFVLEASDE